MAQKHKLKVEKRTVEGKKVKKLRREGILPGNVYGADFKSTAVQVPYTDFNPIYNEAGETGLIDLQLGEQTIPVLIHNIHQNFRNEVLHADFFKVNLKEKVKAMIPLEFVGQSPAVSENIGLLEKVMHEVEIEALPTDLPEHIEVNVDRLAQIDDQITVEGLKVPTEVTVLSDPGQVIVKVGELITKEAQEEAEAEAAAAEAAKAESAAPEGGEGVSQAEGEAPAEGGEKSEEASAGEEQKNKAEPSEG